LLWRWRQPLWAATCVTLIVWSVEILGGRLAALTALTGLLAVVALVKPVRRLALGWAWGVVTPQRVRQACIEAGVLSGSGRPPGVVFTRRTPYGEVVYLYCPRGLRPADLAAAKPAIAAFCWAERVEVLEMPLLPSFAVVAVERPGEAPAPSGAGLTFQRRLDRHAGRPSPTFGPIG
jgi:hypothetical protein